MKYMYIVGYKIDFTSDAENFFRILSGYGGPNRYSNDLLPNINCEYNLS